MSSGIANIASGDYVELRAWRGLDWTLSVKTLRNFAEIERFILARRGDVLATSLAWVAQLPKELLDDKQTIETVMRHIDQAMRLQMRSRFATQDEINEYNNTPAGMGHRLWLAAREHHSDRSVDDCTEHVLRASLDEIARLSDALDGVDQKEPLKNSDGPEPSGAE